MKRNFFEMCAKRMDMFKKHKEIVYKPQRPSFDHSIETYANVIRD